MVSSAQSGGRKAELTGQVTVICRVSGAFERCVCQKYCMKEAVLPEFR